jgi:hypothetical protein
VDGLNSNLTWYRIIDKFKNIVEFERAVKNFTCTQMYLGEPAK